MASKYATAPPLTDRMPGGIPYIVGNEAAERFSFYGMKTILFIFMTQHLLGRDGEVAAMTPPEATETIHFFVAAVYAFAIPGAILSDVLWGKYRTIIYLSLVYCLGHAALAVDETRLGLYFGLGLIAVGAGGIKPCVSAHVGDQFGDKNKHLIPRIFQWFYFAINLGAFLSTLLTPWLMARYGSQVAFAIPGVLMLLATIVFWWGRYKFVHIPPSGTASVRAAFSGDGLRAIFNLLPIYLCVAMFWALFDQTGSSWIDQAAKMDREFAGVTWYSSQIQAANPILILAFIPLFSYVIYPLINRVIPLTPLRKIGIGFFICVAAFAVPTWIQSRITGGQVVQFKQNPDEHAMRVAPEADSDFYPVENLIDGRTDGTGWATPFSTGEPNRPAAVIRLRGQRAWEINAVEINPWVAPPEEPARTDASQSPFDWMLSVFSSEPQLQATPDAWPRCRAKEVEVLVSDSRVGPWQSVGRVALQQDSDSRRLTFDAVEAEYVMLRVLSNFGGDYAVLGEATVFTADEPARNVAVADARPNIIWQLLAYMLLTAAEVMISITCLEFSYTQAPPALKSFIMSIYLLSVALGNLITAGVNHWIQNPDGSSWLEGADYFLFFTGLIAATAVVYVLIARFYRGKTYIQGAKED